MSLARAAAAVVCFSTLFACPQPLVLPVPCSRTATASDFTQATQALAQASAGSCVVLGPGTYRGALTVPEGVALLGESLEQVELVGGSSTPSVVTLGAGSTLAQVRVVAGGAVGVTAGRKAQLLDVSVASAKSAGLVAWCEEDCRVADELKLVDVTLTDNAVGLLVRGAAVKMERGAVKNSSGLSLASGYGLVVSHGGALAMVETVVEGNAQLGVLVDGAGTSANLEGVAVRANKGRGIWAQGLDGSMSDPRLRCSACAIEGNALVGLGARGSKGIRVQGGRIAGTKMGPGTTDQPGQTTQVGDGVGLFQDTGEVQIDAVSLDANERSQALIDRGATGLLIQATLLGQSQYSGVVVQRTQSAVQAPMIITPMPGSELSISAPSIGVPPP